MWWNVKAQLKQVQSEKSALEEENSRLIEEKSTLEDKLSSMQQDDISQSNIDQFHQQLDKLRSNTSDNIVTVREDSASFAATLHEQQSRLSETSSLFQQASSMLSSLVENLSHIQTDSHKSRERIESVNSVTHRVREFVGLIEGISGQTNLLALNAAIEAARAGEQGRGFAVVSDEVRILAQRTSEATSEISELVHTINNETEEATQGIRATTEKSDEMSNNTQALLETVNQVVDLSQTMRGVILEAAYASFINTVKMDHIVWKNEVYKVFIGQSEKTAADFASHHQCRLGKWYFEGDGAQLFSRLPSFPLLDSPHRTVHESGVAALQSVQEGDWPAALGELERMEQASNEVLRLLSQLYQEIQQQAA